MRWVVELSAESGGTAATVTVDGESWKSALSAARSGRTLTKFRVDFDDEGGVRVQDANTNERFVLRPLVPPATAASPSVPPPTAATEPPAEAANAAPAAPASESAETSPDEPAPTDVAIPAPGTLLFARNREAVDAGLTFRERVLAVPPGTSSAEAEQLARAVWDALRERLLDRAPGQLVSIAVFDHPFRSRPERAPLAVLTWKDWIGPSPEVSRPASDVPPPSPVPVAPAVPSVPPPAPSVPEVEVASIIIAPEIDTPSETPSAPTPTQTFSLVPPPPRDEPRPSAPLVMELSPTSPAPRTRGRGDELLAEAFEGMQDLTLLSEPEPACAFAATLARELLQASVAAVSLYDIDRDELVLQVTEGGPGTPSRRTALNVGARGEAALRNQIVTLTALLASDPLLPEAPSGPVLYAPARHDRRLFAVLQLHRSTSEPAFDPDEQHAASYIATQLGKFLADHSKRVGFEERPRRR